MEPPPVFKRDEQYPLLKVATGITDAVRPPPPAQTQSWSTVTCAPKQSLVNRWPQVLSASWMTLTLLSMSFLVFYTVSMGAYRSPTATEVEPNIVKPSINVFFHHVVYRGCHFPFALYADFVQSMAVAFPKLRFNLLFLVDDALRNTYYIPRHARSLGLSNPIDEVVQQEIRDLEKKHCNVNVTIMCLNKYMAMTPLKHKWRSIPATYLSFYARIFSVWQYGGIGMDLTTYNNLYCNKIHFDRRITEILKNHNEFKCITDYKLMLRPIDDEEENCFKSLEQMWNDTLSIFNNAISFGFPSEILDLSPLDITPTIRAQREKRDVNNNFYEIVTSVPNTDNDAFPEIQANETVDTKINNLTEYISTNDQLNTTVPPITSKQINLVSSLATSKIQDLETKPNMTDGLNQSNNNPERSPAVRFYDFSVMSDNVGRVFSREPLWPKGFLPQRFGFSPKSAPVNDIDKKKDTNTEAHLALTSDGLFVAATEKMHPFLGMMLTAGFQTMRPEFAIQDTFLTKCSGICKNQAYCNIYKL